MSVWVYIIMAAIFQIFWGFVVKRMNMAMVAEYIRAGDFTNHNLYIELIPIILYFILGLIIVMMISKAYKMMPMSQVYAYWMGLTILFQTTIDVLYFKESLEPLHIFFIFLIMVGIIGMKKFEPKEEDVNGLV